jgi:radical SAM/Cys-rich protein
MNEFDRNVMTALKTELQTEKIEVIQVNVGYLCNQQCAHCHLEASPYRKEIMEWTVMASILELVRELRPKLVDITGGSPELNFNIQRFISELRKNDIVVQLRTNLTAFLEPGLDTLPAFFRDNRVKLVASMPCYLEENVRVQRGPGTYEKSIEVLKKLNLLGYGIKLALTLDLVYNLGGPFLPSGQSSLEKDYKRELYDRFKIEFNNLLVITNMPLGKFLGVLEEEGRAEEYRKLLRDSFNPDNLPGLMCRSQISIGWDGQIYDCDFNLALGLGVHSEVPGNISDISRSRLVPRKIITGEHCFGCTAGFGSSCGGALIK